MQWKRFIVWNANAAGFKLRNRAVKHDTDHSRGAKSFTGREAGFLTSDRKGNEEPWAYVVLIVVRPPLRANQRDSPIFELQ